MIIWLDAQLSPTLAPWIQTTFKIETRALRDIGLLMATDQAIFDEAAKSNAILVTKDSDFIELYFRKGAPPQIIWLTCGNSSNRHLKTILLRTLPKALELLSEGENLVEISN